ncbi:hypothetical protein F5Y18DRAFT_421802 [Xylariaceae sp. FL1019]|nr:hypothetical protein F5Y18DRAFT_421802 [Xylariaceae sp. FL1019]
MEKTVSPYEADWKAWSSARASVASPTCIAVKTIAMYTVAEASQCSSEDDEPSERTKEQFKNRTGLPTSSRDADRILDPCMALARRDAASWGAVARCSEVEVEGGELKPSQKGCSSIAKLSTATPEAHVFAHGPVERVEVHDSTGGHVLLKGRETFDAALQLLNGGIFKGRALIADGRNGDRWVVVKQRLDNQGASPRLSRVSEPASRSTQYATSPVSPIVPGPNRPKLILHEEPRNAATEAHYTQEGVSDYECLYDSRSAASGHRNSQQSHGDRHDENGKKRRGSRKTRKSSRSSEKKDKSYSPQSDVVIAHGSSSMY